MKIYIDNVKPGMIISSPVMKENTAIVILNSDVVLTDKLIDGLKKNGVKTIDIKFSKEQEIAYNADLHVFSTIPEKLKENAKESIRNFNTGSVMMNAQLIAASIMDSDEFKYNLSEYKEVSDIFSHSVRVAAFAVLLAKYYNNTLRDFIFEENVLSKCRINLEHIATAAMLHDLGKLCKEPAVLNTVLKVKNNLGTAFPAINDINLAEFDEKNTSIYSYLLTLVNKQLNPDVKMMILLSGEDEIGTGPLKPKKSYISSRQNFIFGSKIIKLCSMYDDELKNIIDQNATLENISAKLDYDATNGLINEELEKLFIEHIPLYSKGVKVKLSDGRYAVVEESFNGRTNISKPLVITIPDGEIIDLRMTTTLTIQEVCSDEISFLDIVNMQIKTMEQELSAKKKS